MGGSVLGRRVRSAMGGTTLPESTGIGPSLSRPKVLGADVAAAASTIFRRRQRCSNISKNRRAINPTTSEATLAAIAVAGVVTSPPAPPPLAAEAVPSHKGAVHSDELADELGEEVGCEDRVGVEVPETA